MCAYRGGDVISLKSHVEDESVHNSFEHLGMKQLPEVTATRKHNFESIVIDDEGNIEVDGGDEEWTSNINDNTELFPQEDSRKRKRIVKSGSINMKKLKPCQTEITNEFSCGKCGKKFTRKGNLKRHTLNIHGET